MKMRFRLWWKILRGMNSNQWDLKEKDNNQISVVGTNVARATT